MKNKTYMLNTILAVVLGLALLIAEFVRAFAPNVIIPELSATNMVALSLVALVIDYYVAKEAKRSYVCIALFAAAAFGILPAAACFVTAAEAVKLAALGAAAFTACTWLFTTMSDRLSTGPVAKAAPVISAFGLYLAAQCLMGMF